MNFTSAFIQFTQECESPTSFWRWSAYALIAAILRDNIYFEHGTSRTYPNIYVLLLADSAEYRKGGSFPLVTDLLYHEDILNTKIVSGTTSIQALADTLSQDIGNKKGTTIRGGSCILLADELSAFFVDDIALIPRITQMWEFKEKHDYNLRSGSVIIKNLCVSILAASNEVLLRDVYTSKAVYGGLLGRTLIIKPNETRKANSQLEVNPGAYNKKPLIDLLKEIRKLKGFVSIDNEGKTLYNKWYEDLYASYKKFPDKTGMRQRMHRQVLKLAMIIMAAENRLTLCKCDIEEAILEVSNLQSNYEVFSMSSGKSDQAEIGAIFLNYLWETEFKRASRRDFLLKHWQNVSSVDLDNIIATLGQAGLLKESGIDNEVHYEMTPKCKEMFEKR